MDKIIDAKCAINAAQNFNRNCWLNRSYQVLSDQIMTTAKTGLRSINVSVATIVGGAENMFEAGEMLQFIQAELDNRGYKVTIDESGKNVTIKW